MESMPKIGDWCCVCCIRDLRKIISPEDIPSAWSLKNEGIRSWATLDQALTDLATVDGFDDEELALAAHLVESDT